MTNLRFHTETRGEDTTAESMVYLTKNAHPYTVIRHDRGWLEKGEFVEEVAFWHHDTEARISNHVLVHWTNAFEWMLGKWPAGGEVKYVVTNKGRKIYCTSISAGWSNWDDVAEKEWNAAPAIMHVSHKIVTLGGRTPMLEVKGAGAWCYHRDNARFETETRNTARS